MTDLIGGQVQYCFETMTSATPHVKGGKVVGVISIGDIVKNIIEQQGDQIKFLETYIRGHGAG